MSLAALASALAEEPRLTERAYVVLEKQDLGERHRRTDVSARTLFGDVTRCSAFFCPRLSDAVQCPRGAAAADGGHGCVRLQAAQPSLKT